MMRWRNTARLEQDLRELSRVFHLLVDDELQFVIVRGLKLPPGYNLRNTELLLVLPSDYPSSPPGVGGSPVYLSPALRLNGRTLDDLHDHRTPEFDTPSYGPWAWFCYEQVDWSPVRDNLIKFVEVVRADLTQPKTRWIF